MLPQENFLILDALRSILLLFGTLFYHGKASVIASDAHADWAAVYEG